MSQTLSVSQALALVKGSLEQISATIIGEVSEFSDKPGYKAVYFTISDTASALSCLIWRNVYQRAGVELRQGMLVEVSGVFSVYAAKGRMNFEVRSLRLAGEGELRLKVALLAKKLEAEGLMDPKKKRPVPQFPAAIAVVTSPRGKAIHDVLRTLRRRFPLAEVLIFGVPVEGIGAAQSIIDGLKIAQASRAELILLVRGGGSYEDLMPFNDEQLARTIAACTIPIVTGIGHEPDNSIADMVCDYRASTPTAAAEHVTPDIHEVRATLDLYAKSMNRLLQAKYGQAYLNYDRLKNSPVFIDRTRLTAPFAVLTDGAAYRLQQLLPHKLKQDRQFVDGSNGRLILYGANLSTRFTAIKNQYAAHLSALSPLAVLGRGYSITYDENGHVVDSVDKIDLGQQVMVRLVDGSLDCQVNTRSYSDLVRDDAEETHV